MSAGQHPSAPTELDPADNGADGSHKPAWTRWLRRALSLALLLGIAALGADYFIRHRDEFQVISDVSIGFVIAITGLKTAQMLAYALQLKVVMAHFGRALGVWECFAITRITQFSNMVLPFGGGGPLKAVYLKRVHQLPFSSFVALSGATNMLKLLFYSLAALALLLCCEQTPDPLLIAVSAALLAASIVLMIAPLQLAELLPQALSWLRTTLMKWRELRRDLRTMVAILGLICVVFVLTAASNYSSFRAFDVDIPFTTCALIAAFSILSSLLHLAPANLGIREAIVIGLAASAGVSANEAVHVAALDRVIATLLTIVLGPSQAFLLAKRTPEGEA